MNYTEEALKTATNPKKIEITGLDIVKLQNAIFQLGEVASSIKQVKEKLFYGKDIEDKSPVTLEITNKESIDLLHSSLGLMTETYEIIECLLVKSGQLCIPTSIERIDVDSLNKERGDLQWYENLLNRAFNTTDAQIKELNIKKLRKRYGGDKFIAEKAIAKEDNEKDTR